MFKLNMPNLKVMGKEIKALFSIFGSVSDKQQNAKGSRKASDIVFIADSRRRRNTIECGITVALYGILCYEYREDGTIRII